MDFSENYSFPIQDETQGYYWSHSSCTMRPVVLHYQEGQEMKSMSLHFLSEDLIHDLPMVCDMQCHCITLQKELKPYLFVLEYFNDECVAQYKNRKSFYILCKHEKDFGVRAMSCFFAISHRKGASDGVGETVKKLTAKASLQKLLDNQIKTSQKMFEFCKHYISGIDFIYLPQRETKISRNNLYPRFIDASPVKDTSNFNLSQFHLPELQQSVSAMIKAMH